MSAAETSHDVGKILLRHTGQCRLVAVSRGAVSLILVFKELFISSPIAISNINGWKSKYSEMEVLVSHVELIPLPQVPVELIWKRILRL